MPHHQQTEDYGGGHIQARHGRVNFWLLLVYLVMFVWALYYGYTYWGGLGPGLNLGQ
jgi:Zn-dependent protease with chaperone function